MGKQHTDAIYILGLMPGAQDGDRLVATAADGSRYTFVRAP